jgi:hypothetical protein
MAPPVLANTIFAAFAETAASSKLMPPITFTSASRCGDRTLTVTLA